MTLLRLVFVFTIKGIIANDYGKKSYSGYQVWKVSGNISEDVIGNFSNTDMFERDNNSLNFLLNPNETRYWNGYFRTHNISYEVVLKDVQSRIDAVTSETRRVDFKDTLSWSKQPGLTDVNKFLRNMAVANPTYCKLISIGKTAHKKDIYLLKLSNGNKKNKALLIDAGLHGCEWTAVLSALYLIESIASNFSAQPDYVKNLDWYILPLMNPDGYEHSITKDRRWRKNTRRLSGSCNGVDLNKNFEWGEKGSSQDTCRPVYSGTHPFSEEETKAFRNLVEGKRFLAYVSIHSSGTKVLYPWMFEGTDHTPDYKTHVDVTKEIVMAMRAVDRAHYTNGNYQKVGLERGSGMSVDWMYFVQNVVHSYLIETRGAVAFDLSEWYEVGIAVREVRAGLLRLAQLCHH